MKEIGGYFGLELASKEEYHTSAINLNSGRNAFKYILEAQDIKKIYTPNFICNSIIEPLIELFISYEFYNIDGNYEIIQEIDLLEDERILYINYFALKSKYVKQLAAKYQNNLIIDNAQELIEN